MARKKSATLPDGELRIMTVLWARPRASVKDVTEQMASDGSEVAYSTVLTMLRILHEKGYVSYEKEGRAFIYSALIDRDQERDTVLQKMLNRFFNGSPSLLVQNLLDREDVNESELLKLQDRIARRIQEEES